MKLILFITALALIPTAAAADPISSAIASITWGAVKSFLIKTALSVGFSILAQMIMRPDKPGRPDRGINIRNTGSGGDAGQRFIMGRYATGGQLLAPPFTSGSGSQPNARLHYVIGLSCIPGVTFRRWWVDGEEATLTGEAASDDVGDGYEHRGDIGVRLLWRDDESDPPPYLLGLSLEKRPWENDMVGSGLTYALTRFYFRQEQYRGKPSVRFEVDGIPLLDPRDGVTRQTDNPVIMIWNVLRGIEIPAGENSPDIWGYGVDADDLPDSVWFAAMNECDVQVDDGEGGTVPQYRAGIEVDVVEDEPAEVIDRLLNACAGQIVEMGGRWRIRVGGPGAPVLFITDDDIVITENAEFEPFPSLQFTNNAIHASYPEPDAAWEPKDAPPRYNADFEADDDDRRLVASVEMPAVWDKSQVQRLMISSLEEERRFRRHRITLPPSGAVLEPLDSISWTSERNFYDGKVFEVSAIEDDLSTLAQGVALRERDPDDYDPPPNYFQPTPITPPGTEPIAVQGVPGWGAQGVSIEGGDAVARRPDIRLTWFGFDPNDPEGGPGDDIQALNWEVRLAASQDMVAKGSTEDIPAGELLVGSSALVPDTAYEVRGRFVAPGRPTEWTAWVAVTTDDVRLSEADFAQAVRDRITEIEETADDASARHDAALDEATGAVGDLRDAAMAAYGPLDVEVSLRDAAIAAYGPLDVEVSLSDRVQQADRDITFTVASDVNIDERLDLLSERAAELAILLSQTDKRMADAGVFVDPENGRVRIQADGIRGEAQQIVDGLNASIQQRATFFDVNEAIAQAQLDPAELPVLDDITFRLTTAEQIIDAHDGQITTLGENLLVDGTTVTMTDVVSEIDILEGQISERVTVTDFNELGSQVSEIEQDLGDFDGPRFRTTLRDVSTLNEEVDLSGVATLRDLLTNYGDRKVINEAISLARQDMWARADATDEAVAGLRVDLGVSFQNATSLIQQESNVRASEFESFGEIVDQIETTITDPETGLEAQGEALSLLDSRVEDTEDGLTVISRDSTVISAAVVDASDDAGLAELRSQLDDHDTRRRLDAGVSQVRQDSNAVVEEGREALATTRQELTAGLQSADARITNTQSALATEEQARIEQVTDLEGRVEDNEGALTQINLVDVTSDSALVQAHLGLEGQVNDPDTGLAAATGAINELNTVDVTSDSALVQAHLGLEGQVNDPDTGLAATRGTVTDIINMNLGSESAIINRFEDIEVELNPQSEDSIAARLGTVETAKVDESGAVAAIDALVEAQFGDLTTFTEFQQWAIANEDGTNAGFRFGIDGQNVISAVKVDQNGNEDPSTTLELAADQIRLNGDTRVDGTFFTDILAAEEAWLSTANIVELNIGTGQVFGTLQSENFETGVSGWQLTKDGAAEFGTLELREESTAAARFFQSGNVSDDWPGGVDWKVAWSFSLNVDAVSNAMIVMLAGTLNINPGGSGNLIGRLRVKYRGSIVFGPVTAIQNNNGGARFAVGQAFEFDPGGQSGLLEIEWTATDSSVSMNWREPSAVVLEVKR